MVCSILQVTEGSESGDKESSVLEGQQSDNPNRTAAPSQASTVMPLSNDKNTSVTAGDGMDMCDTLKDL